MEQKIILFSHKMNGSLDDDYTIYEDGTVLHEFDKNEYPGGQNLQETLQAKDLSSKAKERLLAEASDDVKELVKKLLGL